MTARATRRQEATTEGATKAVTARRSTRSSKPKTY
jgi:hypothetical protein